MKKEMYDYNKHLELKEAIYKLEEMMMKMEEEINERH